MKSVTTDMAASLHKDATNFARLWELTRKDGSHLYMTDHDQGLTVSGIKYRATIGFTPTAVVMSSIDFTSQQCEINVAMTPDGIREEDVRARKWDGADAIMKIVDWTNPTSAMTLFSGEFGRITITEKGRATIEVLSKGTKNSGLNQALYSMTCRNSLGDKLCFFNIENARADFTVTEVSADGLTITCDNLRGQPDGYYSLGQLVWETGNNPGEASEVQTYLKDEVQIGLVFAPSSPVQVGDTGHVYPGCDLLVQTCFTKFNNVLNFNGEPWNIQPRVVPVPASTGSTTSVASGPGNRLIAG